MSESADVEADPIHTETRGEDTAVVSATVDAQRPVVFTAFTDPTTLASWFWPSRFGTTVESDLQPGGAFAIRAAGLPPGQDMGLTGVYQEVEEPARLTMTWHWDGETAVSHVAIDLTSVGEDGRDRTQVVVTHSENPTVTDQNDHLMGWRDCLGRLVEAYGSSAG